MKKSNTIDLASIRAEYAKAPQFSADNTHEACICKVYYDQGKKFTICVNYWMPSEIAKGERTVFGESQELIEKLYI